MPLRTKTHKSREQGGVLLTTLKGALQNEKDIPNRVDIAPFRTNIGINKNIDIQSRVELEVCAVAWGIVQGFVD
jgi:hypothetical protein